MATRKVTVTLDEGDLRTIRGLVAAQKATSVSGFVQHAVSIALLDVAGWSAELALALEQTGGPISAAEKEWADGVLAAPRARRRRRSRAA